MNDPVQKFDAFVARIRSRLEAGRTEYGDRSFALPLGDLIDEVQQELEDISAWSFIAWTKMEGLKARAREVEERVSRVLANEAPETLEGVRDVRKPEVAPAD